MNDLNSLLDQSSYLRLISANGSEVERTTSSIGLTAQKKYVPSEYVSCIRINGKPILPPVMTPERKLECLEWKQKALDVEEKLCVKRKEKIIETIKLLKTSSASAPPRPSSVPIDEEYISNAMISPINDNDVSNEKSYFENADEYSSTKCLNTETIKDSEHEADGADCEGKLDNLASVQIENCSSDIIDINSETDENSKNVQMEELNQCNVTNGHQNEGTQEMTTESRDDSSIKTPIYKRERRGSYTLDEPSPLLLAYMERFGQNFNEDNSMNQTASKMSHVSQVKAVNLNPEMSSTVEMHPKEKENCLVDYLSQLSQPPESKTLLNTVEKSHDSITDYTVNGDIVTESKTVNGSLSQNKSVEDDDCPGLQEPLDNEVQKYLVENKETERINLRPKTPPDLEASTLTDDPSINNEYLSTKIKKLSSTVQNETEIIQKRILSLEQTRQALTNRTDNQDILQIGIPKQSNVNTEEYDTSKIIQKSPNMISPSMNSIASSLQESMSIRVPSSRGPKEQITKSPSKETAVVFSEIQMGHIKQDNNVQFSSSPTNNLTTITSTSTRKSSRQTMELAVSSLAKSQQDEIQKLMQQQEKERLELKQLFEQQQKRLIQELLYQFNSRSETPSSVSSTTIEVGYPSSAITRSQVSKTSNSDTSTLEASIRSLNVQNTSRRKQQKAKIEQEEGYNNGSSNISQVKIPHNNDNILLLSSPQTHRSTSPVIPALPMYLRPESRILPSNFHVPSEVFTDARLHKGFCKISALVKGHLIRRLMKTDRVLRVIGSMRDTMTIALQLHQEVKESKRTLNTNPVNISTPKKVSIQDIELHRRLLQQLLKDSQEFHNIFFKVIILLFPHVYVI